MIQLNSNVEAENASLKVMSAMEIKIAMMSLMKEIARKVSDCIEYPCN